MITGFTGSDIPGDILSDFLADTPPDLKETLQTRLQSEWQNPPVKDLIKIGVLPATALTDEEHISRARQLLFAPTKDDLKHYVTMLEAVPASVDQSLLTEKVALADMRPVISSLAMLYLRHLRNWELASAFVLAAGFQALLHHVQSHNPYLRSQTIDCMLRITSSDVFDWFGEASCERDKQLHRMLLAPCRDPHAAGTSILPMLLTERPDEMYPNESFSRLQLLGFWLSWVRKVFLNSEPLQLGRTVLGRLASWTKGRAGGTAVEAELQLAKQLHEDFGRSAPLPDADASIAELHPASNATKADHDQAGIAAGRRRGDPSGLKADGNAAFQKHDYINALELYTAALQCLEARHTHDLISSLYANRAACYLQLAGIGDATTPPPALVASSCRAFQDRLLVAGVVSPTSDLHGKLQSALRTVPKAAVPKDGSLLLDTLLAAIDDCDSALALDAQHVKSLFRKTQALTCMGRFAEASIIVSSCIAICKQKSRQSATFSQSNLLTSAINLASGIAAYREADVRNVSSSVTKRVAASFAAKEISSHVETGDVRIKAPFAEDAFVPQDPATLRAPPSAVEASIDLFERAHALEAARPTVVPSSPLPHPVADPSYVPASSSSRDAPRAAIPLGSAAAPKAAPSKRTDAPLEALLSGQLKTNSSGSKPKKLDPAMDALLRR